MMKYFPLLFLIFMLNALVGFAQIAPDDNAPNENPRGNLVRELQLSPDQIRELRRINQTNRPKLQAAQARNREAARLLDEAVYADALDEALIRERIKAAQRAQTELIEIRIGNELAIRKILLPDKLVKFRELRRRIKERRRELPRRINRRNSIEPQFVPPSRTIKNLRRKS